MGADTLQCRSRLNCMTFSGSPLLPPKARLSSAFWSFRNLTLCVRIDEIKKAYRKKVRLLRSLLHAVTDGELDRRENIIRYVLVAVTPSDCQC